MTTSVSLWTVSAIGIAVGAGLYICSVVTVILIMLINHVLVYISHYQEEMNKEIAFYVEIKEGDAVKELVAYLKDGGYKISSIFPLWLPVSAGSLFIVRQSLKNHLLCRWTTIALAYSKKPPMI